MALDKEDIVNEEEMTGEFYEGEVVDVDVPSRRIGIVLDTADEEMIELMFALGKRVRVTIDA